MDFLYSISLLLALIAGVSALALIIAGFLNQSRRVLLTELGKLAVRISALSLILSVMVHWHWGHDVSSLEPMSFRLFVESHPAFLVAGAIIAIGLLLSLRGRKRGGID
jgi:hypothetical protein